MTRYNVGSTRTHDVAPERTNRLPSPIAIALRFARAARRLLRDDARPAEPPKNKHLWSIGLYAGSGPLALAPDPRVVNPVISRDDVTDISAGFVADPFLFRHGDDWFLFFEAFNRATWLGEIGVATSRDLAHWEYQRIVLAEPFHLSYPFVFEWEGAQYMMPEVHKTRSIRLYRATQFPVEWTLVHTLMTGDRFADSTPFRHDGRWWLFTETSAGMKHDTLRLFHADDLLGEWTEHPMSPVVRDDPHSARPAGPVLSTPEGLLRFAQDCAPRYGLSVRAFAITTLTPTEYVEHEVPGNPILAASGSGWNEAGMHQVSAVQVEDGQWVAAVDGWAHATLASIKGTA